MASSSVRNVQYRRKQYLGDDDDVKPRQQREQKIANEMPKIDETSIRNKMIKDILQIDPNITFPNSKKREPMTLTLIPLNRKSEPEPDRSLVCDYLINNNVCDHTGIHNYEAYTMADLEDKGIHTISEKDYGVDYPVVSRSKLVYCQLCLKQEHPLLVKSIPKGSLNFFCSMKGMANVSHVTIPDYVNMNEAITIHGDDVWVNFDHQLIHPQTEEDIRDRIIATTGRKNFRIVHTLPPPLEAKCDQFSDFGVLESIVTNELGYGQERIIVQSDVDKYAAEVESDHEDVEEFDESVQSKDKIVPMIEEVQTQNEEKSVEETPLSEQAILPPLINEANDSISSEKLTMLNEACAKLVTSTETIDDKKETDQTTVNVKNTIPISRASSITSEHSELSAISEAEDRTIDQMLQYLMEEKPPHATFSTLLMLEKTYLLAKKMGTTGEIVLDFKYFSNCVNIAKRDWNYYVISPMGYSMLNNLDPEKDIAELLIHLKYNSSIPEDKVRVTSFYISIDLS